MLIAPCQPAGPKASERGPGPDRFSCANKNLICATIPMAQAPAKTTMLCRITRGITLHGCGQTAQLWRLCQHCHAAFKKPTMPSQVLSRPLSKSHPHPRLAPLLKGPKGHWRAAPPLTVLLACIASCIFDGRHVISCHFTSQYKK